MNKMDQNLYIQLIDAKYLKLFPGVVSFLTEITHEEFTPEFTLGSLVPQTFMGFLITNCMPHSTTSYK